VGRTDASRLPVPPHSSPSRRLGLIGITRSCAFPSRSRFRVGSAVLLSWLVLAPVTPFGNASANIRNARLRVVFVPLSVCVLRTFRGIPPSLRRGWVTVGVVPPVSPAPGAWRDSGPTPPTRPTSSPAGTAAAATGLTSSVCVRTPRVRTSPPHPVQHPATSDPRQPVAHSGTQAGRRLSGRAGSTGPDRAGQGAQDRTGQGREQEGAGGHHRPRARLAKKKAPASGPKARGVGGYHAAARSAGVECTVPRPVPRRAGTAPAGGPCVRPPRTVKSHFPWEFTRGGGRKPAKTSGQTGRAGRENGLPRPWGKSGPAARPKSAAFCVFGNPRKRGKRSGAESGRIW
jgi:hypothetical protein